MVEALVALHNCALKVNSAGASSHRQHFSTLSILLTHTMHLWIVADHVLFRCDTFLLTPAREALRTVARSSLGYPITKLYGSFVLGSINLSPLMTPRNQTGETPYVTSDGSQP